ncbi:lipopolysaccharide 3-alpha-galactosyltransferase [Pectobacterium cacticida]|uniref:lipopolysaccharide 3-alpha-galactosyltransferase n=1 Tax=Pectobacterium cacticida TaxID=69221 RepID=UPI002FF144E4
MYFNKDTVISDTFSLNHDSTLNIDNSFNIAYGIDKNFIFGCGISIASILLHNKDMKFTFHIFTDEFSNSDIKEFKELSQQYNTQIVIYIVDCEELKSLPSTKNWSYATYFRFIIADYFYGNLDTLLYLDADIVCKGKLIALEKLDLNHSLAAVVTEGEKEWWEKRANALGNKSISHGYFNAGFLLINIEKWGAEDISGQAINLLSSDEIKRKISFLDQDILNLLLIDKVVFLEKDYNTQYSINYELKCKKNKKYAHGIRNETIFIHYIGPTKPWHEWAVYPSCHYFNIAKNDSPWKDFRLKSALSTSQFRYCSKHEMHQGKILKSISSKIKYLLKRSKIFSF